MKYEPRLVKNELTGAEYYYVKHPSGLSIYVMEMEGYSTAHTLFGTKYGSVNTTFKTKRDRDFVTVPAGIAHFLEHKLFENEDIDAFELYAKTGASGNAYTSFGKTVYLFSCTDNFKESLSILLDFVQNPYFTDETVAKEQGIIGQEIKMCEDNPYRAGYFNLLRALYSAHPIRTEVAGIVESIAKITPSLLYRCYNTFYNLNNMVLSVAGNCKTWDVLEVADRLLKPSEDMYLESLFPDEPSAVACGESVSRMSVGIPLFNLGFKAKPCKGKELIKKEYASGFLTDMIFGPTSGFYSENMESGLINSTFESETLDGDGYFCNILSGESRDPYKLRKSAVSEIERVKREGLSRQDFEDLKRAKYASAIRIFTNVQGCASLMLNAHMADTAPFDAVEVLRTLTFEDVMGYTDELLNPESSAISIIEPDEQ